MDHYNSGKNLDFSWLFTQYKQGTLEQSCYQMGIQDLGEINLQIDYQKQQMAKKQDDTPQLVKRNKEMVNALNECGKIVFKVISEKGPQKERPGTLI